MTILESFERMQEVFNPKAAAYLDKTIQWNISGEYGGQWAIHIHNQTCDLITGSVEQPDILFQAKDTDWLDLAEGKLNSMQAFATGKLKVSGDMMLAMRMANMFPVKHS